MDYLVSEGYPLAAQKFASEANFKPKPDVDSIQERVEIREAIDTGDIQTAIEKINDLNPQVRCLTPRPRTRYNCYDYICSCTTHNHQLMRNNTQLQSSK